MTARGCNRYVRVWSPGLVLEAILAAMVELGRAPRARDFVGVRHRPSLQTVVRLFGSFNAAITCVGLQPQPGGGRLGEFADACRHGHAKTPDNVYLSWRVDVRTGRPYLTRRCRTCHLASWRRRKRRTVVRRIAPAIIARRAAELRQYWRVA